MALTTSQLPAFYDVDTEPEACRAAFSLELERLENWFDSARIALGHRAVGVQQPFCLAYTEQDNRDLMRRYGNLCCRIMRDWHEGSDRDELVALLAAITYPHSEYGPYPADGKTASTWEQVREARMLGFLTDAEYEAIGSASS